MRVNECVRACVCTPYKESVAVGWRAALFIPSVLMRKTFKHSLRLTWHSSMHIDSGLLMLFVFCCGVS